MWLVGLEGVSHRFLRARGRAGENEKPGHALQRPGGPGGRFLPPDAVPLPEEDTRKRIVDVYMGMSGSAPARRAPRVQREPRMARASQGARAFTERRPLWERVPAASRGAAVRCGPPWYVRPLCARVCCS